MALFPITGRVFLCAVALQQIEAKNNQLNYVEANVSSVAAVVVSRLVYFRILSLHLKCPSVRLN